MTRKALGRGLDALIPRQEPSYQAIRALERHVLPVDRIRSSPWQPRKSSDPVKMDELVRSIQVHGILEPILVRRAGEMFELVAGERRLRAAQRAGINEIPVIIVDLDDKESLEVALIENIQREDLSPVDEARAYQILVAEFKKTHDEIATQVGKDRSTVSNLLRLLKLPEEVLSRVASGALSVGHARALLALDRVEDQVRWADKILETGWSVREIEERIALSGSLINQARVEAGPPIPRDPHLSRVEEAIRRRVGSEVHLHMTRKGNGRLELRFADQTDLERILDLLGVQIH